MSCECLLPWGDDYPRQHIKGQAPACHQHPPPTPLLSWKQTSTWPEMLCSTQWDKPLSGRNREGGWGDGEVDRKLAPSSYWIWNLWVSTVIDLPGFDLQSDINCSCRGVRPLPGSGCNIASQLSLNQTAHSLPRADALVSTGHFFLSVLNLMAPLVLCHTKLVNVWFLMETEPPKSGTQLPLWVWASPLSKNSLE